MCQKKNPKRPLSTDLVRSFIPRSTSSYEDLHIRRLFRLVAAANLFLVHFEGVTVCHFESIRRISRLHARTVKKEAHRADGLALAFAKRIHQLLQLGATLDLEEDLVVIICDFDVQMF